MRSIWGKSQRNYREIPGNPICCCTWMASPRHLHISQRDLLFIFHAVLLYQGFIKVHVIFTARYFANWVGGEGIAWVAILWLKRLWVTVCMGWVFQAHFVCSLKLKGDVLNNCITYIFCRRAQITKHNLMIKEMLQSIQALCWVESYTGACSL